MKRSQFKLDEVLFTLPEGVDYLDVSTLEKRMFIPAPDSKIEFINTHEHSFNRIKECLNMIIEATRFKSDGESHQIYLAAQRALCYIPEGVNNGVHDRERNKVQQVHDKASEGHKSG